MFYFSGPSDIIIWMNNNSEYIDMHLFGALSSYGSEQSLVFLLICPRKHKHTLYQYPAKITLRRYKIHTFLCTRWPFIDDSFTFIQGLCLDAKIPCVCFSLPEVMFIYNLISLIIRKKLGTNKSIWYIHLYPVITTLSREASMKKIVTDEDGIRTHAGRAQWISSPSP